MDFSVSCFQICRPKVTQVKFWYERKCLITRNVHVEYESSTSNGSKVKANVKVFRHVSQRSRSRSQGKNFLTWSDKVECLVWLCILIEVILTVHLFATLPMFSGC